MWHLGVGTNVDRWREDSDAWGFRGIEMGLRARGSRATGVRRVRGRGDSLGRSGGVGVEVGELQEIRGAVLGVEEGVT